MAHELETAIATFRNRAIEARAELSTCADPELRRYLTARAHQADAEAGAMQQSVDAWKEHGVAGNSGQTVGVILSYGSDRTITDAIEADVARAESAWGSGQ